MVLRCSGRITAGAESRNLQAEVTRLTLGTKNVVLNIKEVDFIDSGGLGVLVRIHRSLRADRGDLKICGLRHSLLQVFQITHLHTVFDICETEAQAVESFRQGAGPAAGTAPPSKRVVLCVDESKDVLAYLSVLLRRLGYEALTTHLVSDFARFLKASRPDAVLAGHGMQSNQRVNELLEGARQEVPVIFLPAGFSAVEAGEAGRGVADRLQALFPAPGSPEADR
jgi:anti-sigma B factor antagonist